MKTLFTILLLTLLPDLTWAISSDFEIITIEEAKSVTNLIINTYRRQIPEKPEVTFFVEQRVGGIALGNGSAHRNGKISITLALKNSWPERIPPITAAGLAFIVCHEVGHLLGGEPRYGKEVLNWAPGLYDISAEGQADYFAAKVCMPSYFRNKIMLTLGTPVDEPETLGSIPAEVCKSSKTLDSETCEYVLSAGYKLIQLVSHQSEPYYLAPTLNSFMKVSYFNTSPLKQPKGGIDFSHPDYQCRIDTIKAGVLGLERPICWYNL